MKPLVLSIWLLCAISAPAEQIIGEPSMLSLSAVKNQPAVPASVVLRSVAPDSPLPACRITGKDADAFRIVEQDAAKHALKIAFDPLRGFGHYQAAMEVGTSDHGTVVRLEGIGLNAFEGKNEPPLHLLVQALGIPLNVGGTKLELNVKADKIGDGVAVKRFNAISNKPIRVTPIARFSPPGLTPFGWTADGTELHEIGQLADSSKQADAHQSLFPPLASDAKWIEFKAPATAFAFYVKGHLHTAFSDPSLPSKAKIPNTVRVFPVTSFQGKPMTHAWLVCCEEASNGDYQDAVFLLENVKPE